jgi:hypothetical protein
MDITVHIARGAHGVLSKNNFSNKNFYSRPHNNLPQKIPCGRTPIFARIVHIRAIYGETMFFFPSDEARATRDELVLLQLNSPLAFSILEFLGS